MTYPVIIHKLLYAPTVNSFAFLICPIWHHSPLARLFSVSYTGMYCIYTNTISTAYPGRILMKFFRWIRRPNSQPSGGSCRYCGHGSARWKIVQSQFIVSFGRKEAIARPIHGLSWDAGELSPHIFAPHDSSISESLLSVRAGSTGKISGKRSRFSVLQFYSSEWTLLEGNVGFPISWNPVEYTNWRLHSYTAVF